jgi:hypothetical protein
MSSRPTTAQQRPKASKANYESSQGDDQGDPLRPWHHANKPGLKPVVIERLRHEGDGILLIYDNALSADAIRPYLPRGGAAKVIVTSNARVWRGVAEPVEIRLWPKEIGADFLIARTGRIGDRAAAEDLSEALGGLPLAHERRPHP